MKSGRQWEVLLQHPSFLSDTQMPLLNHNSPQREATLEPIQLFWRPNPIVRILCYCPWVAVFVLRIAIPFKIPDRSPSPVSLKVTPKSMFENR